MVSEITFTKGGITVTVQSLEVNDNFSNKLFILTPAQSVSNQASGSRDARVVDLLRVTHQIVLRAYITGTASATALSVKRDLVNLWKGAGEDGGVVTMTYDQGASAFGNTDDTTTSTIYGYIEKINFKDVAFDQPSDFESSPSTYPDVARYEVTITFLEGVQV